MSGSENHETHILIVSQKIVIVSLLVANRWSETINNTCCILISLFGVVLKWFVSQRHAIKEKEKLVDTMICEICCRKSRSINDHTNKGSQHSLKLNGWLDHLYATWSANSVCVSAHAARFTNGWLHDATSFSTLFFGWEREETIVAVNSFTHTASGGTTLYKNRLNSQYMPYQANQTSISDFLLHIPLLHLVQPNLHPSSFGSHEVTAVPCTVTAVKIIIEYIKAISTTKRILLIE